MMFSFMTMMENHDAQGVVSDSPGTARGMNTDKALGHYIQDLCIIAVTSDLCIIARASPCPGATSTRPNNLEES